MTVTELAQYSPSTERAPRWIPTRAGILNVWRYYDEIFEFHQGRLLLRGPNGSGKSKALELLLPFLFDASLRPNRLSTFGTSERTMHWNLMGDGASGATRVGYVWLEFCLPGVPDRYFTCGARLQATSRTTSVHADYFTTGLRVHAQPGSSSGLSLTEAGRPLTRAALAERLGGDGVVHENPADYRTAVRTTLFAPLSEDRYDALITALLQLRTPKLSQRLDPALLSTLLSRALPPLSRDEIADLAEGFERLDAQRERLARLDEEVAATRKLARHQQTYTQRVLRAQAAALSASTTELEKLTEAAKRSSSEFERITALEHETEERVQRSQAQLSVAEAERNGLMKSPAYEKGLELDNLRTSTTQARKRAMRAAEKSAELLRRAEDDAVGRAVAIADAQRWARIVADSATEAERSACRAGLISVHDELAAEPDAPRSRALVGGAVRARRGQVDDLMDVIIRHEGALARRTDAESDLEQARASYLTAEAAHTEAIAAFEHELDMLRERVRIWAGSCSALSFDDPEALADLVEDRPALVETVTAAESVELQEVARGEIRCQNELELVVSLCDECAAQHDRIAGEEDIPPATPHWRTADRSRLPGGPLWRLVDFADGVDPATAAGVEAALESSGLLDAWIGPRGEVTGHDLFADPSLVAPAQGRSLADILIPVADAETATGVAPAQVGDLLSRISFDDRLTDDAVAAVAADGSWRLATLTGAWSKDYPAFIGAATRARVREQEMRRLRAQIDIYERRVEGLRAQLDQFTARRALVEAERQKLPSFAAMLAAERRRTETESDLSAADRQIRERADRVNSREIEAREIQHELAVNAAETGLPTDRAALRLIIDAVDDFGARANAWLDACTEVRAARRAVDDATDRAEQSEADAAAAAEAAAEAMDDHRRFAAELAAIEESTGQDYEEVLLRIERVRALIETLGDAVTQDRNTLTELARTLGRLDTQRTADAAARNTAASTRDRLAARFRHLAGGTFPADAQLPDLPEFHATLKASDGVRAALDAARMVSATWPTIPHSPANISEAMRRLADSVHECRTALSTRADLDLETDEEIQVFAAIVDGVRVGCAELLRIVTDESEQSKNEITERERRLFDHTLTGDTRRHLAARIRQANELVDSMNARLERVRTASDVRVALVWQVRKDLPVGTRAARDLLLKEPARLTDTDRESLHRFLRERIEEAKADDTATSWEQQLAQVFDYTAWHQFIVKINRGDEGFQELTKKLHGALSGGEKAIALHLPLFAAVAAHYEAAPRSPRAIMLDEVFVGVDTANRGQIFALLSALDLDLILTSDHEWCTYAELSGIGIHQIISGDGQDAVTTARFTWDGNALLPQ